MYVEISKEAAEGIAEEYLQSLKEDEFCKFVTQAEKDHEDMGYLIPLIRHFKALEQSLSELEILESGDLSPLEIK